MISNYLDLLLTDALGYRTNRVIAIDPNTYRDLISGKFKNYGLETKWLKEFRFTKKFIFLWEVNGTQQKIPQIKLGSTVLMRILNFTIRKIHIIAINLIIVIK